MSRFKAERLVSLKSKPGLPEGEVNGILEDDFGRLWLGGRRGIFAVARDQLNALADGRAQGCSGILFDDDENDGLLSTDVHGGNQPSACKSRDGKLWFPTGQGLVMIDPASVNTSAPSPPPVFIESIRAGERVVEVHRSADSLSASPSTNNPVVTKSNETRPDPSTSHNATNADKLSALLPPRPQTQDARPHPAFPPGSGRSVEIHFTALDFSAPEKLRFKHRLEGFDHDWVDAGPRRDARYTNLRPGPYQFRVIAVNRHGVWNETGATVAFAIAPFYYQTWWFAATCVTGLLAGATVFYRARVRSLRERQRAEITKSFHDRLAGKLSAIAKAASPEMSSEQVKGSSSEALAGIAQLAQAALRNLRQAISINDPQADTLDGLVTQLIQIAEETLLPLKISLRLDVPLDITDRPISPQMREHVSLLVSEAINNVVKHAEASTVWLRVQIQADRFIVEVEDDGKGFLLDLAVTGEHGLANMKARAAAVRGELEIRSAPGQGTTIRLTISLR